MTTYYISYKGKGAGFEKTWDMIKAETKKEAVEILRNKCNIPITIIEVTTR